jgi:hypothetical protein
MTLHAIKHSKQYCKQQLEKETDPHIKEKIQHYITGLEKEEKLILKQLGE